MTRKVFVGRTQGRSGAFRNGLRRNSFCVCPRTSVALASASPLLLASLVDPVLALRHQQLAVSSTRVEHPAIMSLDEAGTVPSGWNAATA